MNLLKTGRFGKKDDKGKNSEKVKASGVVDASVAQDDTQERVFSSFCIKLSLFWVVRLIRGLDKHFIYFKHVI